MRGVHRTVHRDPAAPARGGRGPDRGDRYDARPSDAVPEAVALADQLESGVLVSRDGDGHTGYNAGNDCVDEAVEDYLVDGTVPQDGLDVLDLRVG